LLEEIGRLADAAIFGSLSETFRTCGSTGCRCHGPGPKHGPHLYISYRGDDGKTTGYYVPKAAQTEVRAGVAAWQKLQESLRALAELTKERALQRAKEERAE
jgi:hypothetical protein